MFFCPNQILSPPAAQTAAVPTASGVLPALPAPPPVLQPLLPSLPPPLPPLPQMASPLPQTGTVTSKSTSLGKTVLLLLHLEAFVWK